MGVSQLQPGRVSTALSSFRMLSAINTGQQQLNVLQTQLATGKKFLLPSEAPTAATQSLALQKLDERRSAFAESVQTNLGYLATADQTLSTISSAIVQARGLAQAAAGDQVTSAEREGMAQEIAGLIRSVIQAANTQYGGRYLFAGTDTSSVPFSQTASGLVRYSGNTQSIGGLSDFGTLISTSIDGANGLAAITPQQVSDLNPALSLDTPLTSLYSGGGADLGQMRIILNDGVNEVRKTVDLSSARTINDLKLQLEQAFSGEAITLTVDVDPTSLNGLRITPSAGTVEIRDVQGEATAKLLGVASGPVTEIIGSDLNPAITLHTPIASLNGNTGIGATAGTGLRITNGDRVSVVDLDGATTIQDVLIRIREADPDVIADISPNGQGIFISSRLSGSNFSIGENGGDNATQLGLRSMTADSLLNGFNLGNGIPRENSAPLIITRRDGSTAEIDLQQAATVQDVLDAINAVDPGVLVASLNTTGNGIALVDGSGTGPLTVTDNAMGTALGLAGSNTGGPTDALIGQDVNPTQPEGILNLLVGLEKAVRSNDLAALQRLANGLDQEAARFAVVQGGVGIQQQQLDGISNVLADRHITIQGQLESLIDVDYAETITQFTAQQQAMQAYLQVAGQSQQLLLLNYL